MSWKQVFIGGGMLGVLLGASAYAYLNYVERTMTLDMTNAETCGLEPRSACYKLGESYYSSLQYQDTPNTAKDVVLTVSKPEPTPVVTDNEVVPQPASGVQAESSEPPAAPVSPQQTHSTTQPSDGRYINPTQTGSSDSSTSISTTP